MNKNPIDYSELNKRIDKQMLDNDDLKDVRSRLINMEKYIYDIKVIESTVGYHKRDIQGIHDDILKIKLDIKNLAYVTGSVTKYLGM